MDKKTIGVLIIIILVGGFLLAYRFNYLRELLSPKQPDQVMEFVFQNAKVVEVKDSSIVVTGTVKSADLNDKRAEERTVELTITPQTVLKNTRLTITREQILSKTTFNPQTEVIPGKMSDFIPGVQIGKIKAYGDLFTTTEVVANEINFLTYVLPVLQQK